MPEAENFQKTKTSKKETQDEEKENKILSALVRELRRKFGLFLDEIEVKDVRIGLAYTGILLSEGYGGVACTPLYEFSCCSAPGIMDTLKGKDADKVLELALSENPLETAVGIATANALSHMLRDLESENFPVSNVDVLDLIKPKDQVAMVGYFGPLVPKILKITEKLTVLEKRKIGNSEIRTLPSEKAGEILPLSDVIILSASTLINRTFDKLLAQKGGAREVILLGPSTPLYPTPFFERGITAVMGTQIFDSLAMLTIVSEAGGTKKLHQYCGKKVAFRKNK
jgi:uncharacterized protein (DUF4213/DUF364 family)